MGLTKTDKHQITDKNITSMQIYTQCTIFFLWWKVQISAVYTLGLLHYV